LPVSEVFQQTLWIGSTGEEGDEQEVATTPYDEIGLESVRSLSYLEKLPGGR
jgi:hypothetical protein